MLLNYFDKYSKEQLESLFESLVDFNSFQAIGLFLTKVCWLVILVSNLWNAQMSTLNKWVFGILFSEYPFTVYLFRELGFKIGLEYTTLMIGMSLFVFIMTGVFNLIDDALNDIADALERKDNNNTNEEDDSDE